VNQVQRGDWLGGKRAVGARVNWRDDAMRDESQAGSLCYGPHGPTRPFCVLTQAG